MKQQQHLELLCFVLSRSAGILGVSQPTATRDAPSRIAWVHGLRGLASWIIVLSHFRLCFWEWSVNASTDGKIHLIQWPFVRLICAGRPAVRMLFVLSGLVLSYSTAKHIQAGRRKAALLCILRGIQTRYWRLMLPALCISTISIGLMWLKAYNVSDGAPGYLTAGVPRTVGGLYEDIWFCVWGALVDMWICGWQPAHTSLWCMKSILVGSYLLYGCWLLHGGQARPPYVHWVVSAGLLFSVEAAGYMLVDCSGTILGGIVAYHLVADTQFHSSIAVVGLISGLSLASFPIGEPNAVWCSWMFDLACKLMRLNEFSKHNEATCAFWYNIAAFLVVMSITQLPDLQHFLSAQWLQATGTVSFALFLVHPVVFWTVGAATYTVISASLSTPLGEVCLPAAAAMFIASIAVSWFASQVWHKYIEIPLYNLVRGWLVDSKEAWTIDL